MFENLTVLSLAAMGLYVLVALGCSAGASAAMTNHQPKWHRNAWMLLALLFVALLVMRGIGAEEWARAALRDGLRSDGSYADRRDMQRLIVAGVLTFVAGLGGWWFYRACRAIRGRRNVAIMLALVSGAAMAFLIAVRLISLHAIDRLLYGPLKLNWIIDVGASFAVLGLAVYYVKLVRARPRP